MVDQGELEYAARPNELVDLGRIPVLFTGDSFGTPDWFQQVTEGNCTLVLKDEKASGCLLMRIDLPKTPARLSCRMQQPTRP